MKKKRRKLEGPAGTTIADIKRETQEPELGEAGPGRSQIRAVQINGLVDFVALISLDIVVLSRL
jgi:hypothetical protein